MLKKVFSLLILLILLINVYIISFAQSTGDYVLVLNPDVKSILANKENPSKKFTFQVNHDQYVDINIVMQIRYDSTDPKTKEEGKFYIKEKGSNGYLIEIIRKHNHDKNKDDLKVYEDNRTVLLKKGVTYEVFVQRHKMRYISFLTKKRKYGYTKAILTFYDKPTLAPVSPVMLDENGNEQYYSYVKEFKWSYNDQNTGELPQQEVNLVVEKPGDEDWGIETGDMTRTSTSYGLNNSLFPTGEYQWKIKGNNGKIWSGYTDWQTFYVDKLPPWPVGSNYLLDDLLVDTKNMTVSDKSNDSDIYTFSPDEDVLINWEGYIDTASSWSAVLDETPGKFYIKDITNNKYIIGPISKKEGEQCHNQGFIILDKGCNYEIYVQRHSVLSLYGLLFALEYGTTTVNIRFYKPAENIFNFNPSLNLRQNTPEETIKTAYDNNDSLEYTLEWNKFIDTDENNPVGSGVKRQVIQYQQDEGGWQDLPAIDPHRVSYNFSVDWNSNYKFRMKAEDNVGNISAWYPLDANYPEVKTPSMPTKIQNIQLTENNINIEFEVHKYASAYKVKWKNTNNEEETGETDWIEVSITEGTYIYPISFDQIDFHYGDKYEFSIATCNSENDEYIVFNDPTTFVVENTPPVTPELISPADGSYSIMSDIKFTGNKTTDPDGHQLTYAFKVWKKKENKNGEIVWFEYGSYPGIVVEENVTAKPTLENGHYRWRLMVTDNIEPSYSSYRELFVDTLVPKEPIFELYRGLEEEEPVNCTNQEQIVIDIRDYSREYDTYPYPEDKDRLNDVNSFEISSNLGSTITINKAELIENGHKIVFSFYNEPVNGEHYITVTSIDKTGNENSSTQAFIFDKENPEQIVFDENEPLEIYLQNTLDKDHNLNPVVEFNWPAAKDKPSTVKNSGISVYKVEVKRYADTENETINIYDSTESTINLTGLNYNENMEIRIKAIDKAGNEGDWSEKLDWYTAAEPVGIEVANIEIKPIEGKEGLYQKNIYLSVEEGVYSGYKIHRISLDTGVEKIIAPVDETYILDEVESHKIYKYFVKTYNELNKSTDGSIYGMEKEIFIPNSLPTIPEITVTGLTNSYLNNVDDIVEINIISSDDFDDTKIFSRCVDYDNDDLSYTYIVKVDGKTVLNEADKTEVLRLSEFIEFNNGSTYDIQVKVTDNIADENGEIDCVNSEIYSFIVDNEKPEVNITPSDDGYVAEKTIQIDAFDSISGIAKIEYKWRETGEYFALGNGDGPYTIDAIAGENRLYVKATDNAGNVRFNDENVYLVDDSAPVITSIDVLDTILYDETEYITRNNEVYLSLDFIEDRSNISSYHYGLFSTAQLKDGISSISIGDLTEVLIEKGGLLGYKGEQLIQVEMLDGERYYPVIMVTNSVGLSSEISKIEPGFFVDGSAPELNMSIEGLIENNYGTYLTNLEAINMIPDLNDPETGIKEICYGITSSLYGNTDWFASIADLKKATNLNEGETYYFTLKAVNNLGVVNSINSDIFTVDTGKPEFVELIGGEKLPEGMANYVQRSNDYLKVSWIVNDISRIVNYKYKVGTAPGIGDISIGFESADLDGWLEYDSTNYQDFITISEADFNFPDGIYYITVKAVDEAGNESISTTNPVEINTQLSPVPVITTDSLYLNKKHLIYFTIEIENPEQDIKGYRYWVEGSNGNIIMDNKEINTEQNIIDIEENGLSLQDGENYYIYAQVRYSDNSYSEPGFTRVIIDSTPPVITGIFSPEYASDKEISINWNGAEDYSLISYRVKIGTEENHGDIIEWTEVGRKEKATFTDLEVDQNQVIYATIEAVNSSGLTDVSISEPIVIDITAPPEPVVIDEGLYSNVDTELSVDWKWTLSDPESGIKNYQLALLTSRNISEDIEWITVSGNETEYTFEEQLTNNQRYYIAVKSINGAGLSSTRISDGILIDTEKPTPPEIDDHGDYTDNTTTLHGTFSGSIDLESGLAAFNYSLGTYEDPGKLLANQSVSEGNNVTVGGSSLNLEINEVYFFTANAEDNSGLLSAQTTSDGIMVIDPSKPKVIEIIDGGEFTIENEELSFVWKLDEPSIPFNYYQYVLIDNEEASIDEEDWLISNENHISITAEEVYGTEVFEDGKTYYLAVRAVNILGNPTDMMLSDGIIVDSTPPNPAEIGVDGYTNNKFALKWNCTDTDTGITGYQYAIGSSRGRTDITDGWNYIDTENLNEGESKERIDRIITLNNLKHGGRYYLTIKAENKTGLWSVPSISSVIIADLENPTVPEVSTESRNTPGYVNNKTTIEDISFSVVDIDSGIAAYRYQVLEDNNRSDDLSGEIIYTDDFYKTYTMEDLDIDGLNLIENDSYYVAVQCVDRTGNWSKIGYSQPIIVDTIPAILGFDTYLDELVTNDGIMEVNWSTNEYGSLYYRIVPLDEYGNPLSAPEFNSQEIVKLSGSLDFSVEEYGSYEYQIYQIDLADNATGIIKQRIRYNRPPEVNIIGDYTTFKGHTLTFTADVSDDAELDRFVWRVGEYELVKQVKNDNEYDEFTYKFPETGDYIIELEVFDADGVSTQKEKIITVTNTLKGSLLENEIWSGNMEMQGTVEVPEGISLEIEEGTEVSFPESAYLIVRGNLIINGSPEEIITITGTDWEGLLITETAQLDEITYLTISYAERGLVLEDQDISINNSTFTGNKIGIHIHGSSPGLYSCNINNNKLYGVKEETGSMPKFTDCTFDGNGNDYYQFELTIISIDRLNGFEGNSGNIGQ